MSRLFGVLLMAYGSPATLHDVEAYYTHIRGGRVPPAERVAELRARYERIGGRAPLLEITQRQAARGVRAFAQAGPPARAHVGMKHPPPLIPEGGGQGARGGGRPPPWLSCGPPHS